MQVKANFPRQINKIPSQQHVINVSYSLVSLSIVVRRLRIYIFFNSLNTRAEAYNVYEWDFNAIKRNYDFIRLIAHRFDLKIVL